MNRTRFAAAVSLALAGGLVLAGCASDGDGSGSGAAETGNEFDLVTGGTLTVGTEGTYRPFSYHEDGGSGALTGYDIEIITAVAEKLDLEIAFQETQWDGIFAGLDAGRFDVIANQVSINPEREELYLFSTPYTVSPGVVIVPEDNTDITSLEDLAGKTTAQSRTSNWYEVATEAGATVEPVEGWAQAATLLRQGRVDATVNDKLTFLDYQETEGETGLKVAAELDDASENAFAFTKDKDTLVAAVDEALAELKEDGTIAEISEKYFGEDVSE